MVHRGSHRVKWYGLSKWIPRIRHRQSLENSMELLMAEGDCLESILNRVQSPHLAWLRWDSCPYSCLPRWIPMESLRVLQVQGSRLETLWEETNFQVYGNFCCFSQVKINKIHKPQFIKFDIQCVKPTL